MRAMDDWVLSSDGEIWISNYAFPSSSQAQQSAPDLLDLSPGDTYYVGRRTFQVPDVTQAVVDRLPVTAPAKALVDLSSRLDDLIVAWMLAYTLLPAVVDIFACVFEI